MAFAAALAVSVQAVGKERGLAAFLLAHHCEVAGRLAQIHADPRKHARYLILADGDQDGRYVQCLFLGNGEPMLCEAASGFYLTKPDERRIAIASRKGLEVLRSLGFSTDDSEGNFQAFVPATTPEDFSGVATLMLTALYRGYGPRPVKRLRIDAPYGPGGPALRAQCAATS